MAGQTVLEAPERAYTWFFVKAGTHTVLAEWPTDFLGPKKWPDASATEVFEPGESYYFRMAGNVGAVSGGWFSPGGFVFTSQLVRRTAETGKAELIACCRFMSPLMERIQ